MTRDEALAFADRWAEAWNRRAVETVLEHFHDDIVFTSPRALPARPHLYGRPL